MQKNTIIIGGTIAASVIVVGLIVGFAVMSSRKNTPTPTPENLTVSQFGYGVVLPPSWKMQPIPASAKEATPGITTGQEVAFDTSQFTTKQQADFVTDPGAPLAQMGVVQITTLPRDPASTPSSFTEVKRDLTGVTSYKGGYTNGKVTGDIAVAGGIISAKLVPSSGERTIVVLARPVGGDAGIPAILSIIASLQ